MMHLVSESATWNGCTFCAIATLGGCHYCAEACAPARQGDLSGHVDSACNFDGRRTSRPAAGRGAAGWVVPNLDRARTAALGVDVVVRPSPSRRHAGCPLRRAAGRQPQPCDAPTFPPRDTDARWAARGCLCCRPLATEISVAACRLPNRALCRVGALRGPPVWPDARAGDERARLSGTPRSGAAASPAGRPRRLAGVARGGSVHDLACAVRTRRFQYLGGTPASAGPCPRAGLARKRPSARGAAAGYRVQGRRSRSPADNLASPGGRRPFVALFAGQRAAPCRRVRDVTPTM